MPIPLGHDFASESRGEIGNDTYEVRPMLVVDVVTILMAPIQSKFVQNARRLNEGGLANPCRVPREAPEASGSPASRVASVSKSDARKIWNRHAEPTLPNPMA